ncbi:E3 ubiquitin-protein ligase MBR1-like [Lolium rigidum]|uniref:E3 ubiquitin-protein ligase MBR1-like n=1 Tax=Lolium rigidum TaxID=89674 RepID=UPI001F5CF368|nr:E3 ubiquitin-protein ligase MBR1-like [Lolium rigidum]
MEENAGRSTTTVGFLRRGSGVSLRNQSNEERPNQCNNKPGNTAKINPTKTRWAENKEQPRYLHDSFRSSGSKSIAASSSKAPVRKNFEEKPRRPFSTQINNAESSNRRTVANHLKSSKKTIVDQGDGEPCAQQIESEDSLSTSTTGDQPTELDPEVTDSSVSSGSSPHAVDSRTKPRRQKDKEEFSLGRPHTASTSVHQPSGPRNSAIGVKSSNGAGPGVQRRGIKNFGCTSISDVLPSGCSSSNSVHSKRTDITRKRASDAETSSRLRGLSGQSSLGPSPSLYPGITGPRVRASEQSASQQTTRTSNRIIRDSADSARTRQPSTQRARMRMQDGTEHGVFALRDTIPRVRQPDWGRFSLDEAPPQRSARPFPMELPHAIYSSSRQSSSNRTTRSRSSSRPDDSSPQMFHSLLGERDIYRRINMDGIAEVLLALDRIEHDDELSYEQLLVLETNLFLSGLGLHDQHRDLRMDIDDMSYEELLQLEDRIGSVSTALSEEQIAKCLSLNVYKRTDQVLGLNRAVVDDTKCSICQEEYIEGEEIGRMKCEHQYHVCCIQEWLRLKNWCPICKASAVPSDKDKGKHMNLG